MNVQTNPRTELTLLQRKISDLEARILRLKTEYSATVESYVQRMEELTQLHKAMDREVHRCPQSAADEHCRRRTIIELHLEIDHFNLPLAPDPAFYFTELNGLEKELSRHKNRLLPLLVYSASEVVN